MIVARGRGDLRSPPICCCGSRGPIAHSGNVSELARRTGTSREGLYKTHPTEGSPSFATIVRVTRALGLRIRLTVREGA